MHGKLASLSSCHPTNSSLSLSSPRPEEAGGGSDAQEVSRSPYSGGRNQTPKMAAASEERMVEEGGGGHGDGGSCSAAGSAQRQPPAPPSQAPSPGSQAPAAPALAPDHLPPNNTLVALPIVAIENILSFMSYDEISQLRLVRAEAWGGPARAARSWGGSPRRLGTRSARVPGRREVALATAGGVLLLRWHRDRPAGEAPLRASPRPSPGRTRLPAREVTERGLVPSARLNRRQGLPRGQAPASTSRSGSGVHSLVGRGSQPGVGCVARIVCIVPPTQASCLKRTKEVWPSPLPLEPQLRF